MSEELAREMDGGRRLNEPKTYVLMITTRKAVAPMPAPATAQGAIDARCSFEVFPAAISDDEEALWEHAMKLRDRFSTIEGWNTFEVPVIGGFDDAYRR